MADGLTLILPGEDRQRYLLCTSCGGRFHPDHEARWERHVIKCFQRNRHNVEEVIARKEGNVYQSPADKELYAHIRAGGN